MKTNQVAEGFLVKAEACAQAKQYSDALTNYNCCLLFAIPKSQVLSDAFFGRAKVYFEVRQFKLSSENYQNAINSCISEEKCKVYKKCLETVDEILKNVSSDSENSDEEIFKLSHPTHKKVPFIAECLEVRENEIYGRYIGTTKDLNPGDIVVLEEPFYKVLDVQQRHARCAVCLRQNYLNLFPCAKCSHAMFCSKKCSESVIHRYECSAPKEKNFEKLLLQRMFFQAVEITGSLEELQKLMIRHTSSKTIMDFDLSDPTNTMNDKNRILATTSLAEREPWSSEAYAKYESVTEQLKVETEDERAFLRNYLVRCLKSMTVNFFHFFWSPDQLVGQGFALCSLAAYFAHSCDPNVEKIDVDNKFMFVVKKPIKAGCQLMMNYDRYSFLTHTKEQRQEYFSKIYTFKCACNACVNDYPLLSDLPKFDENFTIENEFESLEAAKEQYKKNCNYIQEHVDQYPSHEICSLMVQNYQLLHTIGNKLPF